LAAATARYFDVALGDITPDEAGSAKRLSQPIQQLAAGIGSAAVTSVFFQAATSVWRTAMKVTLVVVLAVTPSACRLSVHGPHAPQTAPLIRISGLWPAGPLESFECRGLPYG